MPRAETIIIGSTDPEDSCALGLLDGEVPVPVRRAVREQVDYTAIENAEVVMAKAVERHEAGDHRTAFVMSLRGSIELLKAVRSDKSHRAPLVHLVKALQDLDSGATDPALRAKKLLHRPPDTIIAWQVRAALAFALEVRTRSGAPEVKASRAIERAFADITGPSRSVTASKIVDWRKRFRTSPVPASDIYLAAVQRLEQEVPAILSVDERTVLLKRFEEQALDNAASLSRQTAFNPPT